MTVEKKTFLFIGILIIISFVFGILSIAPSIDSPNYLEKLKDTFILTRLAIIAQFILVVVYLLIAVVFFLLIRTTSPELAYSYLVFKIVGQIFNAIGILFIIALAALSSHFIQSDNVQSIIFPKLGETFKEMRDFSNHVLMILFNTISSIFLYICLAKYLVIPKWFLAFGLFFSALTVIASILICLKIISVLSSTYLLLNLPLALYEFFIAIILIKHGLSKNTKDFFNLTCPIT